MESVHLIGAEQVEQAGHRMAHAAEDISRAAGMIAEAFQQFGSTAEDLRITLEGIREQIMALEQRWALRATEGERKVGGTTCSDCGWGVGHDSGCPVPFQGLLQEEEERVEDRIEETPCPQCDRSIPQDGSSVYGYCCEACYHGDNPNE